MQLGSMFISNCNINLHVSDAFCVHPQEHLKTVVTASGVWHAASYKANINRCCVYTGCTRVTGLMLHYNIFLSAPEDGSRKHPKYVD
jgi:hypothetical protein